MKGCIIAAVILLLLVAAVISNAAYVQSVTDHLRSELEALPITPDPEHTPHEVAAIREELKGYTAILGLTVSFSAIDRANDALIHLEAYARMGDCLQYTATLALLRDLLNEIARLEQFSVENILWLTPPAREA